MSQSTVIEQPGNRELRSRLRTLAFGTLGGPILWLLQIGISYALVPPACNSGSKLALYGVAGVSGVLTLIAGAMAWRQWQLASRNRLMDFDDPALPNSFLGSLGVAMSLLFALIILSTGVVLVFQSPCPLLNTTVP